MDFDELIKTTVVAGVRSLIHRPVSTESLHFVGSLIYRLTEDGVRLLISVLWTAVNSHTNHFRAICRSLGWRLFMWFQTLMDCWSVRKCSLSKGFVYHFTILYNTFFQFYISEFVRSLCWNWGQTTAGRLQTVQTKITWLQLLPCKGGSTIMLATGVFL